MLPYLPSTQDHVQVTLNTAKNRNSTASMDSPCPSLVSLTEKAFVQVERGPPLVPTLGTTEKSQICFNPCHNLTLTSYGIINTLATFKCFGVSHFLTKYKKKEKIHATIITPMAIFIIFSLTHHLSSS